MATQTAAGEGVDSQMAAFNSYFSSLSSSQYQGGATAYQGAGGTMHRAIQVLYGTEPTPSHKDRVIHIDFILEVDEVLLLKEVRI